MSKTISPQAHLLLQSLQMLVYGPGGGFSSWKTLGSLQGVCATVTPWGKRGTCLFLLDKDYFARLSIEQNVYNQMSYGKND